MENGSLIYDKSKSTGLSSLAGEAFVALRNWQ